MPRWVGMMSLALAALIAQTLRHHVKVMYPLGFFMPAGMLLGFLGLYRQSEDPLLLTVLAVVGVGAVATGTSLLIDRINTATPSRKASRLHRRSNPDARRVAYSQPMQSVEEI